MGKREERGEEVFNEGVKIREKAMKEREEGGGEGERGGGVRHFGNQSRQSFIRQSCTAPCDKASASTCATLCNCETAPVSIWAQVERPCLPNESFDSDSTGRFDGSRPAVTHRPKC